MTGDFIDNIRFSFKSNTINQQPHTQFIETNYGKIRVLDTGGNKPVILTVPDMPNVIEHHEKQITQLSQNFRVVCFEMPGSGFSYPNSKFDYSFNKAARLIIDVMDVLKVKRALLSFSCSNGLYAIKAAALFPERISQLFLSQTASLHFMEEWTQKAVPSILKKPIIGQMINAFTEKKIASTWYKYALPKDTDITKYQKMASNALNRGACFCLSGLVQGLRKDIKSSLKSVDVPSVLIWGTKDYMHRDTNSKAISDHLPGCEIIEFDNCGHFPDLEDSQKYISLLNQIFLR